MSNRTTRRTRLGVIAVAVGALALTACSSGGGGGSSSPSGGADDAKAKAQQASVPLGTAADSNGPAPAVPGAVSGGTINVLQRDNYTHLDPNQLYVADQMTVGMLYSRQLTEYKTVNGKSTLVGDLATDSGEPSDGGKTWTFHLKDGIKFQDGKPITSEDMRWSIERTYASFITQGPTYIQQWLSGSDYRKALPDGPYKGKNLPDTVLSTPDAKTIVFHFTQARPDAPYALGEVGYGVVEKSKDTKQKYDTAPQATGPYMIKSFQPDKQLTLVKNPQWDPKTDPERHQYVDGFNITFGHQYPDSTQSLLSDSDPTSISFTNQVDTTLAPKVLADPSAMKRSVQGFQPYVAEMAINMTRIPDKAVRQAIAQAIPAQTVVQLNGGSTGAQLAPNLISPTVSGHSDTYDPLDRKNHPNGDPAKAKSILKAAGKLGTKLVYAYSNSDAGQKTSVPVAAALQKAGFTVVRKELEASTYYDLVGKVNNPYDIYQVNWGYDWQSASTIIPPQFDGRAVTDGSPNYFHLKDPKVDSQIDAISKISDPAAAAKQWEKLSEYIQTTDVAAVPEYYWKTTQLYGSRIGGVVYDDQVGNINPTQLFLKK